MSDKLSFHDRQHIQKMLAHEQIIASIFNHFVASVSPDLKKWTDTGKNNVWVRNASVEKAIDKRLIGLQADLINVIDNFQMDAWNRSNLKNDKLVKQYIKDMAISEATKKGLFAQNLDMLKEFQNRKEAGMNLSANIWDIAGQTKSQLEFYLESGLSVGRSAATISQDIRQILNDPDKKFHRIKDKNGHLVMSQPMKDYHPGQGQYRSSAMNAKRVAVTETNMMYRKADSARWAEMDFVMGFEVSRSGSNSGACSICDPLTGPYPKGFVFLGFHPFCICIATPILLEPEEFAEYLVNDTIPQERIIRDIPDKAHEFVNINRAALMNSYYVKDNAAWFSDKKDNNTVTDNSIKSKVVFGNKDAFDKISNIKGIEKYISEYNIADITNFKGFTGLNIDTAKELVRSLENHYNMFPELRNKVSFIGSIQGRVELLYKHHYEKILAELKAKYPTNDIEYLGKFADKLAKKRVVYDKGGSNVMAYSSWSDTANLNGIAWNKKFTGDGLQAVLDRDMKSKFHPVGGNSPKFIADHELGHKIDELLDLRHDSDFIELLEKNKFKDREFIIDNLSKYALEKSDGSEFIAEAWGEYLNNPNPRPIAKGLGDLIMKKYRDKFR